MPLPVAEIAQKDSSSEGKISLPQKKKFIKAVKARGYKIRERKDAFPLKTKYYEDRLIQKCKEDGMSDSEIQEWMQEI